MPKQKTHKGLKKRVKITALGKVKYKSPYGSHLMRTKNAKRRRRIGKPAIMVPVAAEKVKLMLNQ